MLETTNAPTPSQAEQAAHDTQEPRETSTDISLTQSADDALQAVGNLYNAVEGVVSEHVRANPYATLAAAAGVGFVLGGGMRSPMGQVLLRLSVRAFGPPLVTAAVNNAVERAQGLSQGGER